jgi:hypothetical protein
MWKEIRLVSASMLTDRVVSADVQHCSFNGFGGAGFGLGSTNVFGGICSFLSD